MKTKTISNGNAARIAAAEFWAYCRSVPSLSRSAEAHPAGSFASCAPRRG